MILAYVRQCWEDEMETERYVRMAFIRKYLHNFQAQRFASDFLRNGIVSCESLLKNRFVKDYFSIRVKTDFPDKMIHEQPGGIYAVIEHKGSYEFIDNAYRKLIKYIGSQGYQIVGNGYETELLGYNVFRDSNDYVVQIAIQVE